MNGLIKRFGFSSRKTRPVGLTVATLCLAGKAGLAFAPGKITQWMVVTNPSSFSRMGEVIAVKRTVFANTRRQLLPQVKKGTTVLISQVVDSNGDGVWDEVLVEVTLPPHAKDTLQIEWVAEAKTAPFPAFTNVRLSLRSDSGTPSPDIPKAVHLRGFTQNIAKPYYQMEGPGIENDKVAFRAFFDVRNGKDIYGKTVDTPVLEQVGVGASWHELQPWGMDVFHTGASLGAGGLAVAENGKIYRLGDADTATYEALYKGALGAAFRLRFSGWDVATKKESGTETVSMTKGNFYYKNEIALNLNSFQHLLAGIANFGIANVVYKKHNATFSSISTYGPQAEGTNTNLGVAILFPSADYVHHRTADSSSSIPNTSYVELKPSTQNKKTIYFFAGWEKTDARFSTGEGFRQYLQESAERLAHPIRVKIINQKSL